MVLKQGMTGVEVAKLIDDLIALGFAPSTGKGNSFDGEVVKAVKAFQSSGIGPNRIPLVIDGKVGPLTRFALDVQLGNITIAKVDNQPLFSGPDKPDGSSQTGWNALQVAKAELHRGAGEIGADNKGDDVDLYRAVTGAAAGDSWCASFVSYCFHEGNPGAMPFKPEAGARALLQQFKDKKWAFNASLSNPPAPGDIIVWWRVALNSWHGHIGIVESYQHGIVTTIEGNRGSFPSRVASFSYTLGQIEKLLGFGRAQP